MRERVWYCQLALAYKQETAIVFHMDESYSHHYPLKEDGNIDKSLIKILKTVLEFV
jgi:hypothetical protein